MNPSSNFYGICFYYNPTIHGAWVYMDATKPKVLGGGSYSEEIVAYDCTSHPPMLIA